MIRHESLFNRAVKTRMPTGEGGGRGVHIEKVIED